jgi:hypothetical protein
MISKIKDIFRAAFPVCLLSRAGALFSAVRRGASAAKRPAASPDSSRG